MLYCYHYSRLGLVLGLVLGLTKDKIDNFIFAIILLDFVTVQTV